MIKTALAVKYRPQLMVDVVGQDTIVDILMSQSRTRAFQHAYLFCGPSGCGKTTLARILASHINEGRGFPIEIDAASNNGVDNVREIIEDAQHMSIDSKYKVYIMDECHMLSLSAWNAMLKLLEESSKYTVFILCTTDPQKVPPTILSRAQRFDFGRIPIAEIVERLGILLSAEGVLNYEEAALYYIAKLASGGMRDAITLLDKCLALSIDLTVRNVECVLGMVAYDVQFEFLMYLTTFAHRSALQLIDDVYCAGKDLKLFVKQFQYFVVDVCKFKLLHSFECISIPELPEYQTAMNDEELESVVKVLDWARQLNTEIKGESNPRAIVETAILLWGTEGMEC